MMNLLEYLKSGLTRHTLPDQISEQQGEIDFQQAKAQFWPFIKLHWRLGLAGAALILLSSLLVFPGPLIHRYLIDDVILARRLDLLPWVILLYLSLKVVKNGTSLLQGFYVSNFQESVMLDLQKSLLDHMLRLPKSFFDKKEIGYLISRINSDLHGLSWFFSGTVVYLLSNLIRFMGGIAFLFYLEWRLAILTVILLPLILFVVRYFSKRMRVLSQQTMEQSATILKHLQETITSIPLVKAFASEAHESQRLVSAYDTNRQLKIERSVVGSFANLMIQTMPELTKLIVLIAGAYLAIRGDWTVGSLLAFQSYIEYVHGPVRFFADANLSLQHSLVAMERVLALFNLVPEENLDTGMTINHLQGQITFKDVSFSYGGDQPVLQDITFEIQPGEHIAIVGPSGVGKTTLISLILAFYKPNLGEICFDGRPTSDYNLPSLRRRIGYVSQSTLLLSGTFNHNLRYGNPRATQSEVEAAAKAAGIHDFIVHLPEGYASRIDERAINLSEGQKQRLSIARALVKQPDVFILDEPTSALDSIVEHSIFQALPDFMREKTLFVVAHRLATVQNSDRILLLNEKQLVAVGTHQTLLAENTFYQELVHNQQLAG